MCRKDRLIPICWSSVIEYEKKEIETKREDVLEKRREVLIEDCSVIAAETQQSS
jgi:hypothetical protein